jgi:hypothetical protein
LVLLIEVAHSVIPVEELKESSLEDEEVIHLSQEIEINIREALGTCLSEVQARYCRDSDIGNELVEERNFRVMVKNHYWSRRYETKDIDGVPFALYDSDAYKASGQNIDDLVSKR